MEKFTLGIFGLGVMGKSLAKNFICHDFQIALYSKDEKERTSFYVERPNSYYQVFDEIGEFVRSLKKPRKILLMITAGNPVDMVMNTLLPYLEKGDIVMDGGNSHYKDTNRRVEVFHKHGVEFIGIGISGGEKGALTGPSMMVGGNKESWLQCKEFLQAIAATDGDRTCCNYVAQEGSGHYVKMVHNGIEYGILQLISETYYFMQDGMYMSVEQISKVFRSWKNSELSSYLIDITCTVLEKKDEDGTSLVKKIKDVAKQKGTGGWTVVESMERGVYIPTIFEAVSMRSFSENHARLKDIGENIIEIEQNEKIFTYLKDSLYIAILCCYAQGIELIKKASDDFSWNIQLADIVVLWTNGCIIRADILREIDCALNEGNISNILDSKYFRKIDDKVFAFRNIIVEAVQHKVCIPALSASLSYYDACHIKKMPVNLIQGLRDCFGAHTYERNDMDGAFHTQWE